MSEQQITAEFTDDCVIYEVPCSGASPALLGKVFTRSVGKDKTSLAVTFNTALPAGTTYSAFCHWKNTADASPQFLGEIMITSQDVTGFTAEWNAPAPTGNYVLSCFVAPHRDP